MELISVEALSTILDIKERTLYHWAKHNTIPAYKLGRLIRFNPIEVMAWLEKSKEKELPPLDMPTKTGRLDADDLVKNAVEGVMGRGYNRRKRGTKPARGQEEV